LRVEILLLTVKFLIFGLHALKGGLICALKLFNLMLKVPIIGLIFYNAHGAQGLTTINTEEFIGSLPMATPTYSKPIVSFLYVFHQRLVVLKGESLVLVLWWPWHFILSKICYKTLLTLIDRVLHLRLLLLSSNV
jgi:hypothetical protein